jgi:uncharacterized membrane protein YeaQ/YmgE (transglycosylase-associated protein family)
MLELIGWDVGMSTLAAVLLVVGALVIGVVAHFIGEVTVPYEWAITGIFALVGGYLGSEAFGGLSTWGPAIEGLYIVPAIIGAIVLGSIVDALVRFWTQGTYTHEPRPI